MTDQPEVADNPDAERFEIRADGELAGFAEYKLRPTSIAFVHTEVDPRFGGRGLGGILVRAALDSARERGLAVLPYCPFVRRWISNHADYLDLVPADKRAKFELEASTAD
ncbi:GNAT family N-acetyltransferase [Saccharopolyspora hirsuta]|uniref:N-acetyltransferase n=1 Tax=Saccharopolyspora hirsuta TaxID=1837 RepID=A0A5M7C2G8_SACHI|nr:GNAT family N-acetyltransferase [Saccharopolyspora hirsuta]KAA5834528.1 N-acetyltransferase [Saccharopolyspora hirsuta]